MTHVTTPNLGAQNFFSTTLTASVGTTDTIIPLGQVPTPSEGFLVIDPNSPSTREIIYYNSKSGTSVTCPDNTAGSGRGVGGTSVQAHNSGVTVEMHITAEYWSELQNGDAHLGLQRLQNQLADFVVTGLTIPTSANLTTTIAGGNAYINGKYFSISSSSQTMSASSDNYVYLKDNGNGTTSYVISAVTNNTTSPTAVTNSDGSNALLVGIAITSGTAITSVNQGSLAPAGPTVSTAVLAICDTNGNLIYPTSPTPGLIGYRRLQANRTSTNTATLDAIADYVCPVVVPAGRKVKVSVMCRDIYNDTGTLAYGVNLVIYNGAVNSGTKIGEVLVENAGSNQTVFGGTVLGIDAPASGINTYRVGLGAATGGTAHLDIQTAGDQFMMVELV